MYNLVISLDLIWSMRGAKNLFVVGASLVGVTRNTVFIHANKDGVMVGRVLVDELFPSKGRKDVSVNAPAFDQIGKHAAHVLVGGRQDESCFGLPFCCLEYRTSVTIQQHSHCLRIAQAVKLLHKADCIPALFFRVIVPRVSPDGHAVIAGKPLILARGQERFSSLPEKVFQVNRRGLRFLLLGKMNIAS